MSGSVQIEVCNSKGKNWNFKKNKNLFISCDFFENAVSKVTFEGVELVKINIYHDDSLTFKGYMSGLSPLDFRPLYEGRGVLRVDDYFYTGYFENGFENGKGRATYQNNTSEWEGVFQNGMRHGKGALKIPNGSISFGMWEYDKQVSGQLHKKTGELIYEGEIRDLVPHGFGTYYYTSGAIYTGHFEIGKRVGDGKYIFKNGDVYEGKWINDEFVHGIGTYSNGDVYEGDWKNSKCNGYGTLRKADGSIWSGTWKEGKLNGKVKYENKGKIEELFYVEGKLSRMEESFSFKFSDGGEFYASGHYPYKISRVFSHAISSGVLNLSASCETYPPGASNHHGKFIFQFNLNTEKLTNTVNANTVFNYENNLPIRNSNQIIYGFKDSKAFIITKETISKVSGEISTSNLVVPFKQDFFSKGNTEEFEVMSVTLGPDVVAYSANSTYSGNTNVFFKLWSGQVFMVDLAIIDIRFGHIRGGRNIGSFSGNIKGKSLYHQWRINSVFDYKSTITAFIEVDEYLIPLQFDRGTLKSNVCSEVLEVGGLFEYCPDKKIREGKVFFLPESGGFANMMRKNQMIIYDNKLNKQDDIFHLTDFTFVKTFKEVGKYYIVGGYTTEKGYLGYANPIVEVLDKSTKKIVFQKVLPLKNMAIESINVYEDGKVSICVAGYFGSEEERIANSNEARFIVDFLNSDGKFKNNLKF